MSINKIGTTNEWVSCDPVLKLGEIGIEQTDNGLIKLKIGDGSTKWSLLPYFTGEKGEKGDTATVVDNGDGTVTVVGINGSVTISDGRPALAPRVSDNGDGTKTFTTYNSDGSVNSSVVLRDGYTPIKGVDYWDGDQRFVEYAFSTSSTTPIGGSFDGVTITYPTGWYDNPQVTDGSPEYMSKATFYYSAQTNTWTVGDWSEPKRWNGNGVSSIVNYYLATNSNSGVTTSTSGWTTSIQSTDASHKYLWNYEKITYSDLTESSTDPAIISTYTVDGKGITSITEEYGLSTDNSTQPLSWSTDVPVLTPTNKYLWNRETISYTVGSDTITDPVIIGVYGDKGDKGEDGAPAVAPHVVDNGDGTKTITTYNNDGTVKDTVTVSDGYTPIKGTDYWDGDSKFIEYAFSTSSTTPTGGSFDGTTFTYPDNWYDNPPTVDEYTQIYSSKCTATKDGKTGTWTLSDWSTPKKWNGIKGSDGVGINSVTNYYLASTDNSGVTTSTSGWTTDIPTLDVTNKYLWNYEKVTYTDNTTYNTTPAVISTYVVDGSNGRGVDSISEEYGLSTDSSNQPSSWSTTVPTLTSTDKYLWNRETITYTDSSTHTTEPVVIGVYGDKGNDGVDGADGVSITTIVNYYLKSSSSSGISNTDSSWSTTVPTLDSTNKYLWNYEEITKSDSSTIKTDAALIGTLSKDGKGIKNITEEYGLSTDSSTQPSSWSTTVPTLDAANKYLWNRETISYTEGEDTTTTPVIIGVYGDKGDTGNGISSITNYYLASSNDSGVTTSTSSWSTTVPTLDSTNKYLWNYEHITYTDSDDVSTEPAIIGMYSSDGSDGNSITGVTEEYAISTSSTTSPTSWSTTPPVMDDVNKYLWNRETIHYSQQSDTTTTPAVIGVYGDKGDRGILHIKADSKYESSEWSLSNPGEDSWSTGDADKINALNNYWSEKQQSVQGSPKKGDTIDVQEYSNGYANGIAGNVSYYYNGSAWDVYNYHIHGSLLVDDSITATKIDATDLFIKNEIYTEIDGRPGEYTRKKIEGINHISSQILQNDNVPDMGSNGSINTYNVGSDTSRFITYGTNNDDDAAVMGTYLSLPKAYIRVYTQSDNNSELHINYKDTQYPDTLFNIKYGGDVYDKNNNLIGSYDIVNGGYIEAVSLDLYTVHLFYVDQYYNRTKISSDTVSGGFNQIGVSLYVASDAYCWWDWQIKEIKEITTSVPVTSKDVDVTGRLSNRLKTTYSFLEINNPIIQYIRPYQDHSKLFIVLTTEADETMAVYEESQYKVKFIKDDYPESILPLGISPGITRVHTNSTSYDNELYKELVSVRCDGISFQQVQFEEVVFKFYIIVEAHKDIEVLSTRFSWSVFNGENTVPDSDWTRVAQ